MNKLERAQKKMHKYRKRIKLLKKLNGGVDPAGKLFSYRSHGAPCSCYLCRHDKFSRKVKHKHG